MTEKVIRRDSAESTAISVAQQRLEKLGWRYAAEDIGEYAAKILIGMDSLLDKEERRKTEEQARG